MPATNQTPQIQLNLWEPEDAFLRTDFNEDNTKIEQELVFCKTQIAEANDSANINLQRTTTKLQEVNMNLCNLLLQQEMSGRYVGFCQAMALNNFMNLSSTQSVTDGMAVMTKRGYLAVGKLAVPSGNTWILTGDGTHCDLNFNTPVNLFADVEGYGKLTSVTVEIGCFRNDHRTVILDIHRYNTSANPLGELLGSYERTLSQEQYPTDTAPDRIPMTIDTNTILGSGSYVFRYRAKTGNGDIAVFSINRKVKLTFDVQTVYSGSFISKSFPFQNNGFGEVRAIARHTANSQLSFYLIDAANTEFNMPRVTDRVSSTNLNGTPCVESTFRLTVATNTWSSAKLRLYVSSPASGAEVYHYGVVFI